jgi:hypothetical protein
VQSCRPVFRPENRLSYKFNIKCRSGLFPVYFRIYLFKILFSEKDKEQVPSVRAIEVSRRIGVPSSPILNLDIRLI